jgi:aminoglycoside phosphotransferase (APT) family kinase protein
VAQVGAGTAPRRLVSAAPRMHADELDVEIPLVRRLLAAQFPEWAELALEPVLPRGTDHAIFRLGDGMSVRLPRRLGVERQSALEAEWLPKLAPHLPLAVQQPLAVGEPALGYPWRWAIHTWLPGEPAALEQLGDPCEAALDLAAFVRALWRIDTMGAPRAARGEPLATRDEPTRAWLATLGGVVDTELVSAMWEEALAVPVWDGPPRWVHGDLDGRNLLARDGRFSGLLDFGCTGIGDPACDVGVAWKLFSGEARERFRSELEVDDATWERARGHVLSQSLGAISYYTAENNPALFLAASRWLDEVLSERA